MSEFRGRHSVKPLLQPVMDGGHVPEHDVYECAPLDCAGIKDQPVGGLDLGNGHETHNDERKYNK